MSSGKPNYSKIIRYFNDFFTSVQDSYHEVALGIEPEKFGGPRLTKILDEKFFSSELYKSADKVFYSNESTSSAIVSIGQGTLDIYVFIQFDDNTEHKAKFSYILQ